MFGGASNAGTAFGAASGSAFGASGTALGGAVPPAEGTANPPFSAYTEKDQGSSVTNHYQTISAMAPYSKYSFEVCSFSVSCLLLPVANQEIGTSSCRLPTRAKIWYYHRPDGIWIRCIWGVRTTAAKYRGFWCLHNNYPFWSSYKCPHWIRTDPDNWFWHRYIQCIRCFQTSHFYIWLHHHIAA